MKKIIFLALLGITFSSQAQTNNETTLSLRQAVSLGIKKRFDIQADQFNIKLAQNDISRDKKAWIPDIHADGSIQYNTQLQPTYVPAGFAGFTEPGMLAFGAKNATVFGLTLNQPLFKPGMNADVKIAKTQFALQLEKMRGNEIEIKNTIAAAYLDVLLRKLQLRIAKSDEERHHAYAALAKGKYEQGALIENDYLRTNLDYENAKINAAVIKQNYNLSLAFLKYQVNLPAETNLVLSDSISTISFGHADTDADSVISQRTEIKQLKLQQQESALRIRRMRQNALPSVSVFGYYAQLFQNENFHYAETKWWAPHSYVGLKFSIPITENFTNKNQIQNYKLKLQQTELDMQQKTADINYELQKSAADLQNATANLKSAKANYDLSQQIYKNQQQQFELGVFLYSDLLDTENSVSKAERSYIQATYNYLAAQLQYEKAKGEW
ncbi:MAG: TolC family protein [Chitinophagaceae bacterium]|nr:MAG: TolC family protein [Chitinophagaceae bacterium]